jgi:hypothetical protein
MAYDEEKWKSRDFEDYGVFILFESYEFHTIKGDALGELVKSKSSKSIHKPNVSEKLDISRFLTGFQKALPNMFEFHLILGLAQLSRTYLGPRLGSSNLSWTCSDPEPNMSDLTPVLNG